MLVGAGRRAPVGANGAVLRGMPAGVAVPEIRYGASLPKQRLPDGAALHAVRVAGAAPAPLRRGIEAVRETRERGLVAKLRRGPEVVFGDASGLAFKWAAAARVLAHPDARGASYVDVRLPDRPVAGGFPPESVEPPAPGPAAPPPGAPPAAAVAPTNPQAMVQTTPNVQPLLEP
jgi:cell division protein FtsQ